MRVLFRGGLRAAEEADVAGVVDMDAAGEGVDDSDISGLLLFFCLLRNRPGVLWGFLPWHPAD